MRSIKSKGEKIQIEERSFAQIKKHYLIEKALASQLKASTKAERIDKKLYTKLYDELFRQVPDHTQLSRLPSSKQII